MTTISDERLAERMEQAAKNVERHAAKQKCWPGDNDYEDAANLLREGAAALRAQGGVRVKDAALAACRVAWPNFDAFGWESKSQRLSEMEAALAAKGGQ